MSNEQIPLESIQAMVDYLWDEEQADFACYQEDDERAASHIFRHVRAVADWLEQAAVEDRA